MREIMVVYKVGKVREVREEVVLPATDPADPPFEFPFEDDVRGQKPRA